jgi:hypothetical protein
MANATFEDHPTDPNKVILRKKPRLDKGRDYEEGFVDGMQHQMQLSVDKAVNAMSRQWVDLTEEEFDQCDAHDTWQSMWNVAAKLKEKNT